MQNGAPKQLDCRTCLTIRIDTHWASQGQVTHSCDACIRSAWEVQCRAGNMSLDAALVVVRKVLAVRKEGA